MIQFKDLIRFGLFSFLLLGCGVKEYPVPEGQPKIGEIEGAQESIADSRWSNGVYTYDLGLISHSQPTLEEINGTIWLDFRSDVTAEENFDLSCRLAMGGTSKVIPNKYYSVETVGYYVDVLDAGLQQNFYTEDLDSVSFVFETVLQEELKGVVKIYGLDDSFEHQIDFHLRNFSQPVVDQ